MRNSFWWPFEPSKRRAVMRCPFCSGPMEPRETREELHVAPSGHGLYQCVNRRCSESPLYRRVDVDLEETQHRVAANLQDSIQQEYYKQAKEIGAVTAYIRDHRRWSGVIGKFTSFDDMVLHVLKRADRLLSDKESTL